MLFSLILPVYGVERYIEKCIRSCAEQIDIDHSEYEVIIVDDSTPDNSVEIANRVILEYPKLNAKIIKRPNGGLSAARNTGLDNASGEFIWFIDSDDYIEPDSLHILKETISLYSQIEILSFGHRNVYPDHSEDCPLPQTICNIISRGIDLISATSFYSAWSRIYRKSLIDKYNMRFVEGIIWEDGEFNLRLLPVTEFHIGLTNVLYNYLRRPQSISTSNSVEKTLKSDIYKYDSLNKWIEEHHVSEEDRRILYQRNNEAIIFCLAGIPQLDKQRRKTYYNSIKKRLPQIKNTFINSADSKHKYLYWAIKYCPVLLSKSLHSRMQKILYKEQIKFNSK